MIGINRTFIRDESHKKNLYFEVDSIKLSSDTNRFNKT